MKFLLYSGEVRVIVVLRPDCHDLCEGPESDLSIACMLEGVRVSERVNWWDGWVPVAGERIERAPIEGENGRDVCSKVKLLINLP